MWIDFDDDNWIKSYLHTYWIHLACTAWRGYLELGRGWVTVDEGEFRASMEEHFEEGEAQVCYTYNAPHELHLKNPVIKTQAVEMIQEYDPNKEILILIRPLVSQNWLLKYTGSITPAEAFSKLYSIH